MTDKERARGESWVGEPIDAIGLIRATIRAAVLAEREACAKVVEGTEAQGGYTGMDETGGSVWESDAEATLTTAAAAIRARSDPA